MLRAFYYSPQRLRPNDIERYIRLAFDIPHRTVYNIVKTNKIYFLSSGGHHPYLIKKGPLNTSEVIRIAT